MGVGGCSTSRPAALLSGKTLYPLYKRESGIHSRSGRVRKISPVPGFDPRTVKPVSRLSYPDTLATNKNTQVI